MLIDLSGRYASDTTYMIYTNATRVAAVDLILFYIQIVVMWNKWTEWAFRLHLDFIWLCLYFLYNARESPVAWEGEQAEGVDNNQASQPGGPESHSSPGHNQGQRRWEAEEESKEDQPQPEDEESTSGVCDWGMSGCTSGKKSCVFE